MNVLFLTHSFPRDHGDAAGSFVLRLAQALSSEGITVRVVAPAAPGLPATAVLGGIQVHRFRYAPRRYETLAYEGTMAEQVRDSWMARVALVGFLGGEFVAARRAGRAARPALLHAHWWFPSGLVAARIAAAANIPLVTTMHGTDVRMAHTIAVSRPAFRYVVRRSVAVTAVSHWLAEQANDITGQLPQVAPMPVAIELIRPSSAPRTRRLLFVGRLTPQKGVDRLLTALAHLPAEVALDVVGDGAERVPLETRAGALGLANRIVWHGAVKQLALCQFYQRAAMLVVPSVDEGLGLVAVEAQLCETPVVALDSGGLADVVQHGHTGVLVRERSALALADGIRMVLERDDRGAQLGIAGRAHALATFSPAAVARTYASIYQGALASHAG